ncbi:hypothetical protein JTB14_018190 [Gonioctena quinquepunctata]|nr:hypothetical protein JTB14_018190 [Gonioctena quinquepunctata]
MALFIIYFLGFTALAYGANGDFPEGPPLGFMRGFPPNFQLDLGNIPWDRPNIKRQRGGFYWNPPLNRPTPPPRQKMPLFPLVEDDPIFAKPFANTKKPLASTMMPSTTKRPITTTVAIPGNETPRSTCEDACQATVQFDPVCGDNGITYTNINWFKCAVNCGKSVQLRYYAACPRPI